MVNEHMPIKLCPQCSGEKTCEFLGYISICNKCGGEGWVFKTLEDEPLWNSSNGGSQ